MGYTDREILKKHVQNDLPAIPNVIDETCQLELFAGTQLSHTNVDTDSERVKILRQVTPTGPISLTLAGTTPSATGATYLVRNSIMVTADISGLSPLIENKDYIVDYELGTIYRASLDSDIDDGDTVYVWFLAFTLLTSGSDYNIDYDEGTITRRAGSSIPEGATVFVDYSHSQQTVSDQLIDQAILEAEGFMEQNVDSEHPPTATDQAIKAAANYYALSIICLSQAGKELRTARDDSADIAKQWYSLGEKYLTLAAINFSPFLKLLELYAGGLMKNRSVTNRSQAIQSPTVTPRYRRR